MQNTASVNSSSTINDYVTPSRKPAPPAWLLDAQKRKDIEISNFLANPPASPLCGGVGGMGSLPVRNLRQDISPHEELASSCRSGSEYLFKKDLIATRREISADTEYKKLYAEYHSRPSSVTAGFKISRYKSGEMVGGFYTSGLSGNCAPPPRTGKLSTRRFTRSALVKLRRSVECSDTMLSYFHTLTFAPSCLQPWHLRDDGTVRHDYAKWKLKKYLDALSQQQRRLGRSLSYAWVAELQKNGNIHFHILLDRFFGITWLTKIWNQAKNSVDIERAKNPLHAARYMRKYITKDNEAEIMGNRYYISQKLRDSMQPLTEPLLITRPSQTSAPLGVLQDIREFLHSKKAEIEDNGGVLLDFGFYVPMPRQSVRYRDKKTGEFVKSKAVSPLIAKKLFSSLYNLSDRPF